MEHPENNDTYKGLSVNAGIEQPASVNPYLKHRHKKRELSVADYVDGIVRGDVTILSRAVTLVESIRPEHQAVAQEVIEKCLPYAGASIRVGISGVPGAGKSTSIDAFGLHVLEQHGGKLAVLAIDPSSERSKGRQDPHGAAGRTPTVVHTPQPFGRLAGRRGTQDEGDHRAVRGCRLRQDFRGDRGRGTERDGRAQHGGLLPAHPTGRHGRRTAGKRGIMEMADGIVINKADGDNLERAKLAANQFRNALHLFPAPESGWTPRVLTYSGFYNLGVKEIWDMIYEYIDFVKANGYFDYRRNEQSKYWMYEAINEHLRDSFYHHPRIEALLGRQEARVLQGDLTSFTAAKQLLDTYFEELRK